MQSDPTDTDALQAVLDPNVKGMIEASYVTAILVDLGVMKRWEIIDNLNFPKDDLSKMKKMQPPQISHYVTARAIQTGQFEDLAKLAIGELEKKEANQARSL